MKDRLFDMFKSPKGRYLLILNLFLFTFLILENVNGRFWLNDFKVYYGAAESFVRGENPYAHTYGLSSGYFKYSPFSILLFIPFTMFSYGLASLLYYIIYVFVACVVFTKVFEIWNIPSSDKRKFWIYICLTLICGAHLLREMHLGNVNLLLLLLLLLLFDSIRLFKFLWAAVYFALLVLIKPHFVILFPLMVLRNQWTLIFFALVFILSGLILPSLFIGFENNVIAHADWLERMLKHNASFLESLDTIHILLYKYVLGFFITKPWKMFVQFNIVMVALFIFIFVIRHLQKEKLLSRDNFFFPIEFFILVALIPNLVLTDSEHFLWSIPLIALVLSRTFQKDASMVFRALAICSFLFFFGDWGDLLGPYSKAVTNSGILGLGNIMIIGLSIYSYKRIT